MSVNSLPKTVTRHRRDCDLNPRPSAPESSTLTTRLTSHPTVEKRGIVLSMLVYGRNHGRKVRGDLTWGGCRSPSLPSSIPSPSPVIALPMFHPFPSILFFPSPLKSSQEVWSAFHIAQRRNDSQLLKLEGTKYSWSPLSPKLERTHPTGSIGWLRLYSCPTFTIFCGYYLWSWLGPRLAALRYVAYFSFCG